MSTLRLELFADYNQFYLQDEVVDGDLTDAWTAEAVARGLAVSSGAVGVGTARNMTVPVVIETAEVMPEHALSDWDRVVECGLVMRSDRLVVAGCTESFPDAVRIPLEPGEYRVRVFSGKLASLSNDGLEGDDHYLVVIWPGEADLPVVVLKSAES
jgi:hypothetical protein